MTSTARLDVVRRAARSALAGTLERRLRSLGVGAHGTLLVAVSGGADSTALLLLSTAVAQRRGWRIEAATVDHHLRPGSAGDAKSACATAETLGVPCARLDVHPGAGSGAPARARRERYAALAAHARARGIRAVLTAHHARDQLETMLMAMMRGAGVRAAGGMAARRRLGPDVELLRPLLEVSAEALPTLCRRLEVAWCHDPTNDDPASIRVRLRRQVIPELEACRAGTATRAAALASLLRSAGHRFESRARRLVRAALEDHERTGRSAIDRTDLRRRSAPVRCEMIRQVLRSFSASPSSRMLSAIDLAIVDDHRHERCWRLRGGTTVRVVADRIEFTAADSVPDRATRRR